MKIYQSIPSIALSLAITLTTCTRPASNLVPTGTASSIPPSTATLAVTKVPTIQDTQTSDNAVPDSTATAQIQPPATESSLGIPVPVTQIPLKGPITSPGAEISGMAWYGDLLILLPQYPNHFPLDGKGSLFALDKSEILDFLQGKTREPVSPSQIPFSAPNLETSIQGFEGFEAIAIDGDQVFMTIEASPGGMMGYLIAGQIASDLSQIRMDTSRLSQIPPQTGFPNLSDEALLVFGSRLISIYEMSGGPFNPDPVAHMFDMSLQLQDTLAFPNVPYRISDATPPDDTGRFWAINYILRGGEEATPAADMPLDRILEGLSQFETLEQLIEFQFSEAGIVLSDTPPIQLELPSDQQNSNWEAIARLDKFGFLLATDEHPDTILGFVVSP